MKKKKKKKAIHLVLRKTLNDPWPNEFGGRSKWDPDRLKPWEDVSIYSLGRHVAAQFDCRSMILKHADIALPSPSKIDEVREIIEIIFLVHQRHSIFLFSLCLKEEFQIYLRIHKVLRSPHGSPIMLVSFVDDQLAKKVMSQSTLDPDQHQFD
jgi:hypothetical protein